MDAVDSDSASPDPARTMYDVLPGRQRAQSLVLSSEVVSRQILSKGVSFESLQSNFDFACDQT